MVLVHISLTVWARQATGKSLVLEGKLVQTHCRSLFSTQWVSENLEAPIRWRVRGLFFLLIDDCG